MVRGKGGRSERWLDYVDYCMDFGFLCFFKFNEKLVKDFKQDSDWIYIVKRLFLLFFGLEKGKYGSWELIQEVVVLVQVGGDSGLGLSDGSGDRVKRLWLGFVLKVELVVFVYGLDGGIVGCLDGQECFC